MILWPVVGMGILEFPIIFKVHNFLESTPLGTIQIHQPLLHNSPLIFSFCRVFFFEFLWHRVFVIWSVLFAVSPFSLSSFFLFSLPQPFPWNTLILILPSSPPPSNSHSFFFKMSFEWTLNIFFLPLSGMLSYVMPPLLLFFVDLRMLPLCLHF